MEKETTLLENDTYFLNPKVEFSDKSNEAFICVEWGFNHG